jgi:hypothetical protein
VHNIAKAPCKVNKKNSAFLVIVAQQRLHAARGLKQKENSQKPNPLAVVDLAR